MRPEPAGGIFADGRLEELHVACGDGVFGLLVGGVGDGLEGYGVVAAAEACHLAKEDGGIELACDAFDPGVDHGILVEKVYPEVISPRGCLVRDEPDESGLPLFLETKDGTEDVLHGDGRPAEALACVGDEALYPLVV